MKQHQLDAAAMAAELESLRSENAALIKERDRLAAGFGELPNGRQYINQARRENRQLRARNRELEALLAESQNLKDQTLE